MSDQMVLKHFSSKFLLQKINKAYKTELEHNFNSVVFYAMYVCMFE